MFSLEDCWWLCKGLAASVLVLIKDVMCEGDLENGSMSTPPRTWMLEDGFWELVGL